MYIIPACYIWFSKGNLISFVDVKRLGNFRKQIVTSENKFCHTSKYLLQVGNRNTYIVFVSLKLTAFNVNDKNKNITVTSNGVVVVLLSRIYINPILPSVHKMFKHTLKILQEILQDVLIL